ncbi:MAG TPA: ferritin-like domain-containing protein [Polyangiaceae bacterium]|jgi:bacterioferritin|nr:MAG: Bacterioferritin [Deltaproteobacteria bacterium ADurb.Bin207]HNS97852.1 ferritin-like domain-containing protein [Polyangiaceae bacterium]HNZ22811.1 ferritin-like domain-containing protein [Polyangiaceae bacterium]HOD24766.1 ferritin-like domain-containing protein [Polyangiaceae bacterium]HOE47709.1 ferritin-like domain-containing protein [Polyangiaceae bacterium]
MPAKTQSKSPKENVIQVLNKARADEIAAILQYMADHYALDDADYGAVAANMKLIAIDEMRHAEMLAERIFELGGMPVAAPSMPAKRGQKIQEALEYAVGLEHQAIADYNEFLEICRANRDSISAKLFEQIIEEEQIHLNYLDNVTEHIRELGAAYLAQIAGGSAEASTPGRGFVAAQGGGA